MIQEVGVDMAAKCILWVKVNPDYEILFQLMDGLDTGAWRLLSPQPRISGPRCRL
jgi:hypothetical protein